MTVTFDRILTTKADLESFDRTNPHNVAALLIHAFCNYQPGNTDNFYDMMQYLYGDFQPMSAFLKQNLKDRMTQNDKYPYIGKSYFKGATPANEYTPASFEVETIQNDHSEPEPGFMRLFLKSGGADSPRPVTLRLAKDGNYYVWSDSCVGLLAYIRPPESTNPWA